MPKADKRRRWTSGTVALLGALVLVVCSLSARASVTNRDLPHVLVVVGAPGLPEYGESFSRWAGQWKDAAESAQAKATIIGLETNGPASDLDLIQEHLASLTNSSASEFWLVLIGHGTFNGKEAKFNLRGPDLTTTSLVSWLRPVHRPLAVINTASASAPFLNALSGENRVIITATRSGAEQNYARFGGYLAESIIAPEADLDKDGQTSLLEAYLSASRKLTEFYELEGRLATEHPLLDDNGDGLGTPPDWFRGVRAIKKAQDNATADGFRAHQFHLVRSVLEQQLPADVRARRNEIELTLFRLRDRKGDLPEADYYAELEKLLVEMARLYEGR